MLDPITALSTAAAIIQLVDFATRISRESYNLISGSHELPAKYDSLMLSNNADSQLCSDLLSSLNVSRPLNRDEAFLSQVIEDYQKRSRALRSLLDTFIVRQSADGSRSWRKQILVAMRSELKKEKVKELAERVKDARDQLSNAFLYLIRREESLRHDMLTGCIVRYGVEHADTLPLLKDEIMNECMKHRQMLQDFQNHSESSQGSHRKGLDEIQQRLAAHSTSTSREFGTLIAGQNNLKHALTKMTTMQRCEALLHSLQFAEMERRKTAIPEHADNTFDWLYDRTASPFADWLESDGKLFCVFGKPGSGKSTLMKFLSDDPRTRGALSQWRPASTLVTAEHYFWYPGEALQKSHVGLLRSLLYSVISMDPIVASCLCQERWHGDERHLKKSWTIRELMQSLLNIRYLRSTKVLLLVDGLDEYYPHNSQHHLIRDLKLLLGIPNVKLCVSSRHWPVFEQAFGHHPNLALENHNGTDIRRFFMDELHAAAEEAAGTGFEKVDSQAVESLAEEITAPASGVFLWVHLVASSLVERLRAGADLPRLRRCLQEFPEDLEEYFKVMIYDRIETTWREGSDTAKALKISIILAKRKSETCADQWEVGPSGNYGSFLYHWMLSQPEGLAQEDFAFAQPISIVSDEDIQRMLNETGSYVRRCARDLLRVVGHFKPNSSEWMLDTVEFTHRTAFDFVSTGAMQRLIDERIPAHFSSPEFHSHLALAAIKFVRREPKMTDLEPLMPTILTIRDVFVVCKDPVPSLLAAEIDKVLEHACKVNTSHGSTPPSMDQRDSEVFEVTLQDFNGHGTGTGLTDVVQALDWLLRHGQSKAASIISAHEPMHMMHWQLDRTLRL